MTKEELIEKLNFIRDDSLTKHMSVFVTTALNNSLKWFCIEEHDIQELQKGFMEFIGNRILTNVDFQLEQYSKSTERINTFYEYDLQDQYTPEMQNLLQVINIQNPELFSTDNEALESINGLYIFIKDEFEHEVVLYKQVLGVDKTYANSSWLYVMKEAQQFCRQINSTLRINPGAQMLMIDGRIVIIDLGKIEKKMHLDEILKKETKKFIQEVENKEIVLNTDTLQKACEKPSMCKKLRHALTDSKVKNLENEKIIIFAKLQDKLHFKFSNDGRKFSLDSKASAERFIKLLDDDYLRSDLTNQDYDSADKSELIDG